MRSLKEIDADIKRLNDERKEAQKYEDRFMMAAHNAYEDSTGSPVAERWRKAAKAVVDLHQKEQVPPSVYTIDIDEVEKSAEMFLELKGAKRLALRGMMFSHRRILDREELAKAIQRGWVAKYPGARVEMEGCRASADAVLQLISTQTTKKPIPTESKKTEQLSVCKTCGHFSCACHTGTAVLACKVSDDDIAEAHGFGNPSPTPAQVNLMRRVIERADAQVTPGASKAYKDLVVRFGAEEIAAQKVCVKLPKKRGYDPNESDMSRLNLVKLGHDSCLNQVRATLRAAGIEVEE